MVDDGKDGLAYGGSGLYAAIVLDVMLPLMDGFEVGAAPARRRASPRPSSC